MSSTPLMSKPAQRKPLLAKPAQITGFGLLFGFPVTATLAWMNWKATGYKSRAQMMLLASPAAVLLMILCGVWFRPFPARLLAGFTNIAACTIIGMQCDRDLKQFVSSHPEENPPRFRRALLSLGIGLLGLPYALVVVVIALTVLHAAGLNPLGF